MPIGRAPRILFIRETYRSHHAPEIPESGRRASDQRRRTPDQQLQGRAPASLRWIARGARSFESNDEYGRVFVHEYSEGQVVVQLDLRVARAARANRLLRPRRQIHS